MPNNPGLWQCVPRSDGGSARAFQPRMREIQRRTGAAAHEITLRCLMMPHEIGIGPRLMSCKSEFASSISDDTGGEFTVLPACASSTKRRLNGPIRIDPRRFKLEHSSNVEFTTSINGRTTKGHLGWKGGQTRRTPGFVANLRDC